LVLSAGVLVSGAVRRPLRVILAADPARRGVWLLLAPSLVFLAAMAAWPFAYLLYASFTSYQLAIPVPINWVGIDNF
jgi:ABC-type sugar transport system permease subunit